MRILDIDMDFFLNKVAIFKSFDGKRLNNEDYKPWTIYDVKDYLENNCGLSKYNKIQGAIFNEHIGVFYAIMELINKKIIDVPISIVHIDAHADLGLGDPSWHYIYTTLLNIKQENRLEEIINKLDRDESGKISSGNYLLYMIALEWIKDLTYIPHFSELGDDYPQLIMKNFDDSSNIIQLKNYNSNIDFTELQTTDYKPQYEVPFQVVEKHAEFITNNAFDYVFFSRSISYTPVGADILLNVFKEYIDFEKFLNSIS